jgi:hypothetical protein
MYMKRTGVQTYLRKIATAKRRRKMEKTLQKTPKKSTKALIKAGALVLFVIAAICIIQQFPLITV